MKSISSLCLAGGNIGIEREMLRVNQDATLATSMHPIALGKTATHPNITTDFAETLLELVTDTYPTPQQTYAALLNLHRYTQANIGNERLWALSMPCILPENLENIRLGYYGDTNAGKIKRLYRQGLSLRYGRAMQMIAGVHFNYSPPDELWSQLAEQDNTAPSKSYINQRYLGMIRNLQRYGWIICYLYGASPAVHTSFTPAHGVLHRFDQTTLGWRNATSLRMSELGYQNKVQFNVSLNDLDTYIRDLVTAVTTTAPIYQHLGIKNAQGDFQQISGNILQISNEYYSSARPKQVTESCELPLVALKSRGIAYVELRLLDVNPFDPCGISVEQMYFLETFMLWALCYPSSLFTHADFNEINHNRLRIACCGNDKEIRLDDNGHSRHAKEWLLALLDSMEKFAKQLDANSHSHNYSQTFVHLRQAVHEQTLMHQQIHRSLEHESFIDWALALTKQHYQALSQPVTAKTKAALDKQRDASIAKYETLQQQAQPPFEYFLAHYFDQLKPLR